MKWYNISTFVNSLRFVRILKLTLRYCESIFYLVFIEIDLFHPFETKTNKYKHLYILCL